MLIFPFFCLEAKKKSQRYNGQTKSVIDANNGDASPHLKTAKMELHYR
jgi:hypothetical protein